MTQRIDAIFENGVFRPELPVNIANGQRVSLDVESTTGCANDLSDVADLLDLEFMAACSKNGSPAPLLEEVQHMLSAFDGSLADRIVDERDDP
jgi:predicted DNA-binding antitoxin AbrB/MazE fold protein